jgi:hypothetical protein
MPINNTYDLYNEAMDLDKPYVDLITTAIAAEIEVQVGLSKNTFDYDAEPIIGELEIIQQLRIADLVINHFRRGGIWCSMQQGFNETEDESTFRVTWHLRDNRQYMKHYC